MVQKTRNAGDPEWSPDGNQIAYLQDDGELRIVNADGTGDHLVATIPGGTDFDWSPDGTQFVYSKAVGDGYLWTMDVDGTNQTRVPGSQSADWDVAWSPDGTKLAFRGPSVPWQGWWGIFVMGVDGSNRTVIGRKRVSTTVVRFLERPLFLCRVSTGRRTDPK